MRVKIVIDSIHVRGMSPKEAERFQVALSDAIQREAESVQDWQRFSGGDTSRPIKVNHSGSPEVAAQSVARSIFGGSS